ncbi:TPR repeat-contain NB-ARC [Ascodesmis nigricans]|uniref:TPR repeat-contain NB-ARC n=1 Tax=Ascodesmis nigricans TaxID=341454 RepID=A0A4S2MNF7_9PEZI|nr:TPR repeat-contain NB-ARC [Ascodesmis nigricans]
MSKNKYGITVLHDPSAATTPGAHEGRVIFDLVAIHGLNGHPLDTWTHKQSGTMWLRDILPQLLPNVRVMTFGYNARFKNFTTIQDLRMIATKLLAELVDLRNTDEESARPIVFICHSLGGIIAKKALLIGCPEEQERIQNAVYGIIFLGTPHNGSNIASLGKLIANVLAACTPLNPARVLIASLQKDAEGLFSITADFTKRRRQIHIVSFFETKMTYIPPFMKRMIVDHHSAILNLPDEIAIPQYSDHREIARFASASDRNFRPVLTRLKKFEEDITNQFIRKLSQDSESTLVPSVTKATSVPFDLPILPCSAFRGRDDVLDVMKKHFYEPESRGYRRRTFALCGLGGVGKTQTILHFIFSHQTKYETGVMFLNATSRASLSTEFARLNELIGLPDVKDKVASVKRWLAKEENSQWLMIFDNADDLRSVPLWEYFPPSSSGHIIIVSRNQEAIGGVAQDGCSLDPLAFDDAMAVLLETALLRDPSSADLQSARDIVRLLGSLPLALTQAGCFMRSRNKTPKEYLDLFLRVRLNVLQLQPTLQDRERTLLSAWKVNFQQIEEESEDAMNLLLLFCFLEPSSISEAVLHRGSIAQQRWDENGELTEVSAEDEGVDVNIIRLIQSDMDFDDAIAKLRAFSFISCNRETNGLRNFSIHPLVQECAIQHISTAADSWRLRAIFLICHAFPRSPYEPLYGTNGRAILPQLIHVVAESDKMNLRTGNSPLFRRQLAATLLAASRFSEPSWKMEALDRAKLLLKDDADQYLNAWLSYRGSCILRMAGKQSESERILEAFVQSKSQLAHDGGSDGLGTPRYNAQRGELIVSFAENMIRRGQLDEAKSELCEWSALDPVAPSTFERIILRARDITLGKVLRYQGNFTEAFMLLNEVLEGSPTDDCFEGSGWYRVLLSGVAELHTELGRPVEAERLLTQELKLMKESGSQEIAVCRRLRISLAETFLERGMFSEATEILSVLSTIYKSMDKPDHATKINHLRVQVSLARVSHLQSHWTEALELWNEALAFSARLKVDFGFSAGMMRFSKGHALHVLGKTEESHELMKEARKLMDAEPRILWIAGFCTRWWTYVTGLMEEECKEGCDMM